jgi:small conductance mechanosensitive channel
MMLSEIGLNIAPMIAGVGVVGIAIGFGAQSLVKDIISGLFILLENQYRRGDVVKIAGTSGLVEDINLRRTLLRDLDGIVHSVPNGEISVSSNYTKSYSRVNLNISVGYNEDLDRAIAVINRVGMELAEDPAWSAQILKPPQVLRVDNLGDSGIDIKVTGDTKPVQQWAITGELRLRIKKAFDQEGIEIPWPHTKIYFGNALDATALQNPKKKE